jgi:homoserine kinase
MKALPTNLLPFAMKGEEMACGHGHADNVAPALMGGFVLIRSYEPLDVIRLPHPKEFVLCYRIPRCGCANPRGPPDYPQ